MTTAPRFSFARLALFTVGAGVAVLAVSAVIVIGLAKVSPVAALIVALLALILAIVAMGICCQPDGRPRGARDARRSRPIRNRRRLIPSMNARLELLPAVDVADGQAVRLVQGAAGSETSTVRLATRP